MESIFERCLLLGAMGDALGAPVEFAGLGRIKRSCGVEAPERLTYDGGAEGKFTDDTQMTLFMAEGLVEFLEGDRVDREAYRQVMADALVRWLATQDRRIFEDLEETDGLLEVEELRQRRAPGNTSMGGGFHLASGGPRPDIDDPRDERPNDSKGCGAVMRSAPYGLAAVNAHQAFIWARDAGVLTHCHPTGYISAGYLAAVVHELVEGKSIGEAMETADGFLEDEQDSAETRRAVNKARRVGEAGLPSGETIEQELGGGWIGEEALAIALACTIAADTSSPDGIREALWRAAVHSGDSDSTAAIAGNLIGAMPHVSDDDLPQAWLEELQLSDVIRACAANLHAASDR